MRIPLTVAALLLAAVGFTSSAQAVTATEVDKAIKEMKTYLYRVQDPQTGTWETGSEGQQAGGTTALVVFALLVSGESYQSPAIRRALEALAHMEMEGTYAVSLRAAVWAQLPDEFQLENPPAGIRREIKEPEPVEEPGAERDDGDADMAFDLPPRPPRVGDAHGLLERDVRALVRATGENGQFGYTTRPSQSTNHSTSHFAYLGLWEAAKRDHDIVPRAIWMRAMRYYVDAITMSDKDVADDGGWGYYARDAPTGSMTAAALTVLLSARQQINPPTVGPPSAVDRAIGNGLAWMNRNYQGARNPGTGTWPAYYLFTLERAALASGVKTFKNQEWYEHGTRFFLDHQLPAESGVHAGGVNGDLVATSLAKPVHTAFALFFLSRGRKPVWISKLEVPHQAWNDRPNDLHFLTRHVSNVSEREYNWQIVHIDTPPETWISAPALYLSSAKPILLDDKQKANLKRYLDLGGMLICNPQIGSGRFMESVRELAEDLYPQYAMRKVDNDHWLFRGLYHLDGKSLHASAMNNGVRDLIVLFDSDWGADWQRNKDHSDDPAWRMGVNLWLKLTGRGVIDGRLQQAYPTIERKGDVPSVSVARASYFGHWNVEPAGWDRMAVEFEKRHGWSIGQSTVDLAKLGETKAQVVHLAGTHPFTLTADEKWALLKYVNDGGMVVVESIGGASTFAYSVEKQVRELFDGAVVPLGEDDPLINGSFADSANDLTEVAYRRYAVLTLSVRKAPRIAAIHVNGRPGVIFLSEDITLGMMGVPQWGIAGYNPEWSRKIAANILLSAIARDNAKASNVD